MEAAHAERWTNHWCEPDGLSIDRGQLVIRAAAVRCVRERSATGVGFGRARTHSLDDFDTVHVRIDPPVTLDYLQTLQLLDFGRAGQSRHHTAFVNRLEALLGSTSKLEPLRIRHASPATLISREWRALSHFGQTRKRTVLKPVHSSQSAGVVHLEWHSTSSRDRAREAIERVSNGLRSPVVLQEDLSGRNRDELRVWLLDGGRLAWGVKTFDAAAPDRPALRHTPLLASQSTTLTALRRHLRRRGIRLAAVDMIGDAIIDLNYASPGMLPELEALTGENLARRIILALARDA